MRELKKLEAENPELVTPDSPAQRVGGKPKEGFPKVPHSRPMLSLDNVTSEEELRDWDRRARSLAGENAAISYVCEYKLDGMSMALRYGTRLFARPQVLAKTEIAAHRTSLKASPAATAPSEKTSPETSAPSGQSRFPSRPTGSPRQSCLQPSKCAAKS